MLGSATKNRLTDEDKKPNSFCAKTYNISGIQSYRTEKSELFEEKANNSCSRNNIIVDQIELLLEKRILLDRVVQKSIPIRGQRLHFRNGRSKRRFFYPFNEVPRSTTGNNRSIDRSFVSVSTDRGDKFYSFDVYGGAVGDDDDNCVAASARASMRCCRWRRTRGWFEQV